MYVGDDEGEDCVTITNAHTDGTDFVRIALKRKDKIHVLYYTQSQFTQKLERLALEAAHPMFFGVCKILNWTIVIWAIWKLYNG